MSVAQYAGAMASASRNRGSARVSQFDIDKTIHEGELLYGEICHVCETHLGDPIGEPRLCEECAKTYVPPKKLEIRYKWLGILGAIFGVFAIIFMPVFIPQSPNGNLALIESCIVAFGVICLGIFMAKNSNTTSN